MNGQVFAFAGNDLTGRLLVMDIDRRVMPSRSISTETVPGMDGAMVTSVSLDPLEVAVECCIDASDMSEVADARKALASALSARGPQPLVLPDDPSTYLMAIYEGGSDLSALAHRPTVQLAFMCPDPVAFGRRRRQLVSGRTAVDAGGNWRTLPVVEAVPPRGSSWQVTRKDTGEFVRVLADFDGAKRVVVDMASQRCTVNGADVPADISSDYFALEGTSVLSLSGGTAEVTWNERWL